jgi:methylglutaconyl-CoA hydratase
MNYDTIRLAQAGDVAEVTLDRADRRNALNAELVSELRHAFHVIRQDETVRTVILTGAGRAFSAGADLEYLRQVSGYSYAENLQDSRKMMELFAAIAAYPGLVIAAVNGPALAGGCGLATACDLVVAAEEAVFGYPEVRIGFVPAIVLNFLLRRVSGAAARELVLTGRAIDAARARQIGLVHEVVPGGELLPRARALAGALGAETSREAVRRTKQLLQELERMPLADGLAHAAEANADSRFTEDCQHGIRCFLEKKTPDWSA